MEKTEIYKTVLADLVECPMFLGVYDAKNGSEQFMYGVSTVMEFIAYNCGEEIYDEFEKIFLENLQKSVDKAQNR
jgi:hypothetical protein